MSNSNPFERPSQPLPADPQQEQAEEAQIEQYLQALLKDTQTFPNLLQPIPKAHHAQFALKLIEAGRGSSVAAYLSSFQGLDHKAIALKLIEARQGSSIVNYLLWG